MQLNNWLRRTFLNAAASEGVLLGYANALACTGTATPIGVATGAAMVYGFPYENDTSTTLAVTTPAVGTTGGHVVLRVNWAAQTVRLFAVRNTDGVNSTPALTQVALTTWEIRLCSFTVTTGGVIAITDTRAYCHFNTAVSASMIDALAVATGDIADNAVTNAKIRQGAALSVIGVTGNATANVADIAAASDGHVLRRSGTSIGFGTVAQAGLATDSVGAAQIIALAVDTAELADNSVTLAKAGTQVIAISGRQAEASGNSWSGAGGTNFTPAHTRIQVGAFTYAASGVVTFPVAFNKPPLVIAVPISSAARFVTIVGSTTTTFTYKGWLEDGTAAAPDVAWIAIGEE